MTRIVLADDQQLVRTGLRMILDATDDLEVVGEAADGYEAIDAWHRHRPDVVLMDVRMPNLDGVAATAQLTEAAQRAGTSANVLMLTTFDLDEYVYAALQAGASGFLLKDTPPDALAQAIRAVADGDGSLAPGITRRLITRFATQAPMAPPPELETLTGREVEVLRAVAQGLSNAEIAEALAVAEATVKTHVGRVLMKLHLRDRVQAVVFAYESGLVQPGTSL